MELIEKNAVRLDLPATMRIHPVIIVSLTVLYHEQSEDILVAGETPPSPFVTETVEIE